MKYYCSIGVLPKVFILPAITIPRTGLLGGLKLVALDIFGF